MRPLHLGTGVAESLSEWRMTIFEIARLFAMFVFSFSCGQGTTTPTPSSQTPLQRSVREHAVANAAALSQKATVGLLDIIATKSFRSGIATLPIANQTSAELLAMWRDQVQLAPVVHNLHPEQFLGTHHMLNDWEQNESVAVEEYIETHVFPGYPSFPKLKCTPAECSERPRYFALNQWGWANGAFFWGDVSMVLKPTYVKHRSCLAITLI